MKLVSILRYGLFSFLLLWCIGIFYFLVWDQSDFWPAVSLSYGTKTHSVGEVDNQAYTTFWSNNGIQKNDKSKLDDGANHHLLACHLPSSVGVVQQVPLIIALPHPQRPFHGNHWFHFGEYYLSQRRYLQAHLESHLRTHFSTSRDSNIQFNHIYIVTADKKIFHMATSFTFFLLLLTLPSEYQNLPVSFIYTNELHLDHRQWLQWSGATQLETGGKESFCPLQQIHVQKEGFHFAPHPVSTITAMNTIAASGQKSVEGYYIGSIGSVPIPSTEWFRSPAEVTSLRNSLRTLCSANSIPAKAVTGSSKPKIVIYQRNEQRKLLNFIETLLQSNQSQYEVIRRQWDIEVVVHDESRDPCSLCHTLQQADVFITSHGFQLTGLFCLPPKSLLIEIFPYKYFKASYFHLARSFGLEHRWFQSAQPTSKLLSGALLGLQTEGVLSLEGCMEDQVCRSYARSLDIEVTEKDINVIANVILSYEPRSSISSR